MWGAAAQQESDASEFADRDCSDFGNQALAQAFFEGAGGPTADPHRLDDDSDGIACEGLLPEPTPTPPGLYTSFNHFLRFTGLSGVLSAEGRKENIYEAVTTAYELEARLYGRDISIDDFEAYLEGYGSVFDVPRDSIATVLSLVSEGDAPDWLIHLESPRSFEEADYWWPLITGMITDPFLRQIWDRSQQATWNQYEDYLLQGGGNGFVSWFVEREGLLDN